MKKTIVIFAALALVFVFAGTTMAADWNFYGQARFETYSVSNSKEVTGTGYSDTDTWWDLQSNARLGANVDAGDVKGRFEFGTNQAGDNVYMRLLYGDWNFGAGTLRVGQSYTPITSFTSNQVFNDDTGLFNVGEVYAGRQGLIQLSISGFEIALIDPEVVAAPAGTPFSTDTDTTLPKIEVAYKFSTDMFYVKPFAGYNSYDVVNATDNTKSIDSYIFGVNGGVTFGPAQIRVNAYMGQNLGTYGSSDSPTIAGLPVYNAGSGDFDDADELGGALVGIFTINDMLSLEAGVGYVSMERESNSIKEEEQTMTYYVQLPITLADGVYIIPEVGMFDYGDYKVTGATDVDQGDTTYVGAKWQINF